MVPNPHEELGSTDTLVKTIARLRDSRELYAQACLRIRDKNAQLIPLAPNFAQRHVEALLEQQLAETGRVRAVVLKARQEGVSTWVAARFTHKTNLWAGQKALIIADAMERAQAIYSIYERYYSELPEDLHPQIKSSAGRRHMHFMHDSEIDIRPASDANAGRAATIGLLHCSEIAFWPDNTQRQVWVSAMQAVPDQGSEIIIESTPNGAGGLFYELWDLTQKKDSGWLGIFLPWWIHEEYDAGYGTSAPPTQAELDSIEQHADDFELQALGEGIPWNGQQYVLPLSRLAWRRRTIIQRFAGDPTTLGKDAIRDFQQEYPATAEEAFLFSGATFFDEEALRRLARHTTDPESTGNLGRKAVVIDGAVQHHVVLQPTRRGLVEVWEKPREGEHYTLGADTAEGRLVQKARVNADRAAQESGGRDYSSASVWRLARDAWTDERTKEEHPARKRALVALIHGQPASDIFARQVALAGEWYKCGDPKKSTVDPMLVLVENNHSSGQRVLEYLKDILHYKRLYWMREQNTRTKNFERRIGWRTDERSRWILLDYLAELIRKDLVEIPDPQTVRELTTFVFDDNGKPAGAEGTHDDRVISLALAAQGEREHRHATLMVDRTAREARSNWDVAPTGTGY